MPLKQELGGKNLNRLNILSAYIKLYQVLYVFDLQTEIMKRKFFWTSKSLEFILKTLEGL